MRSSADGHNGENRRHSSHPASAPHYCKCPNRRKEKKVGRMMGSGDRKEEDGEGKEMTQRHSHRQTDR